MNGSALERTGQHRGGGTNNDKDHASPNDLAKRLFHGKTEVEVEDRYLCHCHAYVVY